MTRWVIWMMLVLMPMVAHAESHAMPFSDFAAIPVRHEGRIKPLDSLARSELRTITGNETVSGMSAIAWLSEILFTPIEAAEKPFFYVPNGILRGQLNLPDRTNKTYSAREMIIAIRQQRTLITAIANADAKTLTAEQGALLALAAQVSKYVDLMASDFGIDWQAAARAYHQQDVGSWRLAVSEITSREVRKLGLDPGQIFRLKLENSYQAFKPTQSSVYLYLAAIIGMALSCWRMPETFYRVSRMMAALAMTIHAAGIICRMVILQRPPVGTLYESILFVAWVIAVICFVLSGPGQKLAYAWMGPGIAAGLLALAPIFQSGDSMEVLAAVLNTNFWLATHVVCITAAYGVCIIASAFSHLILVQQWLGPKSFEGQEKLLRKILLGALFLTAFGTVLGGIWADQSWGRFWGWDPKENGALLIVLWITWILHGRMCGKITGINFFAASAALSIIVALSWFGVNLLSTGLHSYGFIDGMAWALAAYCFAEISFIGFFLWGRHEKSRMG